jgi:hypothetical protein
MFPPPDLQWRKTRVTTSSPYIILLAHVSTLVFLQNSRLSFTYQILNNRSARLFHYNKLCPRGYTKSLRGGKIPVRNFPDTSAASTRNNEVVWGYPEAKQFGGTKFEVFGNTTNCTSFEAMLLQFTENPVRLHFYLEVPTSVGNY